MSNDHVHPEFQGILNNILKEGMDAIDRLTPEQLAQAQTQLAQAQKKPEPAGAELSRLLRGDQ